MLLTSTETTPTGDDWLYEAKYDGFRCLFEWKGEIPTLKSRNGRILNAHFQEIIGFCKTYYEKFAPFLPLTFDGELVHLINDFQSDFSIVQARARMRNENAIIEHTERFPSNYIVFDLLMYKGEDVCDLPLSERKQILTCFFQTIHFPTCVQVNEPKKIQAIDVFEEGSTLWHAIAKNYGEGIVAKRKASLWTSGRRSNEWLKIKNWKHVVVVLTKYNKGNGYFIGAVYRQSELVDVVSVLHGFKEEEHETLAALFQTNGEETMNGVWKLAPAICITVACISFDGKHLREPQFHGFAWDAKPESCTWRQLYSQIYPLPETIQVTHPEKPLWPEIDVQKDDYLLYLQQVHPYMLPFLYDRHLTVIRYPHGVLGEKFYQKNAPEYVPDFVKTKQEGDIHYILCNTLETLLWLGNQLALEFHVPFQAAGCPVPNEIVFDLDPPSAGEFSLAVEAALHMKAIFDRFSLRSFVKTSGGKGLQLYIPLPPDRFSYEDTRVFTKFICDFLCEQEPGWFTTERLKKNRGNKLYLDYVQHHEGKTIIAPYSPRGNARGLVATPLNWKEVNSSLKPDLFPLAAMIDRLKKEGDPFRDFRQAREEQQFDTVLNQLKGLLE